MMDIIHQVKEFLLIDNFKVLEEKVNSFQLKATLDDKPEIRLSDLSEFLDDIPISDDFKITFQVENNNPITLTDRNHTQRFLDNLEQGLKYWEKPEKINFELYLDKNKNPIKHIYNFDSFASFWAKIEIMDLLTVLTKLFNSNETIFFKYLEQNNPEMYTSKIFFGYDQFDLPEKDTTIQEINENCHFGNSQEYPFTPDYFKLLKQPKSDNAFTEKLEILTSLFSQIALFDITSIKDNRFYFKLNGYKSYYDNIIIDTTFKNCAGTYFKIYSWVYSTRGNIADKIGLVRNILSVYLDENILNIDKDILVSIKSSYRTYLKENVKEYVEIRGKILDELSWISQKSGEIVEKYLTNYLKSTLTFLSFFVSVFIIRVLNTGNFSNIFSKEVTILSFGFIAITIIYFSLSRWSLSVETDRLKRKYENIKKRYSDLLIKKDIENILNHDDEFNYEMSFIHNRQFAYTILWVSTLVILAITILSISSFINWKIIYDYLSDNFFVSYFSNLVDSPFLI